MGDWEQRKVVLEAMFFAASLRGPTVSVMQEALCGETDVSPAQVAACIITFVAAGYVTGDAEDGYWITPIGISALRSGVA